MSKSTYNPCLLYKCEVFSIIRPQIDDILILVNNIFIIIEKKPIRPAKFMTKKQACLLTQMPIKFNGI